jgi:hypothetical protein
LLQAHHRPMGFWPGGQSAQSKPPQRNVWISLHIWQYTKMRKKYSMPSCSLFFVCYYLFILYVLIILTRIASGESIWGSHSK